MVDGWFDMAKLVSGSVGTKSAYDELATTIGRPVHACVVGTRRASICACNTVWVHAHSK